MGLIAGAVEGSTPAPNSPPEWTAIPHITGTEGVAKQYNLNNYVIDADGDALTWAWDDTSTNIPAEFSLNTNSGILTISDQIFEQSLSSVRWTASDGIAAPVASPNSTIIIGPAAGSGGGHRWNPGHYARINGDPLQADQDAWSDDVESKILNWGSNPEFLGVVVGIAWGRVNPTGATMDFTDIYRWLGNLASLGNKKLILLVTYKNFSGAPPTYHTPADLRAANIYQYENLQGYCAAVWRDGTGGFTDVRQRFADCLKAIATEFNDHPNFEILSQVEGVTSLQGGAPADYSNAQMGNSLIHIYQEVTPLCTKLNYAPMHNNLSGGYTATMLEEMYQLGIMMGSPDARGVPAYRLFEGLDGAQRDYRNQMGTYTLATHSVMAPSQNGGADYDPDVVINNEQNHQTTHLGWTLYLTYPGKTLADILAAINADPLLHTACPTLYNSCDNTPTQPNQVITSMTLNMGSVNNIAPGNSAIAEESDNWMVTWAWDDNQYSAFGDGKGFHNLAGNAETRASIGVSKISGTLAGYSAQDMWKSGIAVGGLNGKSQSMLGANGKLYMSWDYADGSGNDNSGSRAYAYDASTIWKSSDSGASWTEVIRWNSSDWGVGDLDGFFAPAFLQFGKDYANPRDAYVYVYLMEHDNDNYQVQIPGGISLMRCLLTNLESGNKAHWEFLTNVSTLTWSTTLANRALIFQDATDGNHVSSVSYNQPLGRYILTTLQGVREVPGAKIGVYDAPEPWGPWHTVVKDFAADVGPFLATGTSAIGWCFSNKWLSANGLNFVMVGTLQGKDEWGTVEGTFTFG